MYMKNKEEPIKRLLKKLENSLRGSAYMLTLSTDAMLSPEEKALEMQAIEELTHYIRDYEKNKSIIEMYKHEYPILDDIER